MKTEFARQVFENSWNVKFNKNPCSGNPAVPCGRTDRQTYMKKLTVAVRDFENAPKNWQNALLRLCFPSLHLLLIMMFKVIICWTTIKGSRQNRTILISFLSINYLMIYVQIVPTITHSHAFQQHERNPKLKQNRRTCSFLSANSTLKKFPNFL